MDTIGLLAAMPSESQALLRLAASPQHFRLGPYRAASFEAPTHHCILLTSGMGVTRAAAAARQLVEAFHPALLVSFGIAGAVRTDLKIGDVVMASHASMLEKGRLGPFHPLATLSVRAAQSLENALSAADHAFFTGTAVTTHGSQWADPEAVLLNPVLEMETLGIVAVAQEEAVPLLVLRSISDGPLSPVPVDLADDLDAEYNFRMGRLLLQLLKKPQIIFQASRMMKNSQAATRTAALAVRTVLDLPFEII